MSKITKTPSELREEIFQKLIRYHANRARKKKESKKEKVK